MQNKKPTATIALLTRNSAKTIGGVLKAIEKQRLTDYEILVIDSTSTDNTLDIVKKYDVRVHTIKPSQFGHGKTRNLAAKLANGKFVVFLTHDSVPDRADWLEQLLKPFSDKNVVGTYGRQIPRINEKYLDKIFFLSLYGTEEIVWSDSNWSQGDNIFSDANSAVRKSALIKTPYNNNIIVSEDYEWAARVLKMNQTVVYSPQARVVHSHTYNLRSLFKRNFDVGVSYKVIYKDSSSVSFLRKGLAIHFSEIKYLIQNDHFYLIPSCVIRDVVRFAGIYFGKHESWFSNSFKKSHLSAQGWYWK